jgi:hypothetical protein
LLEARHSSTQVGLGTVECQQPRFLKLEAKVSSARRYCAVLLICASLGAVGVALDPMCLLGIRHTMTWRFVFRHHQDLVKDGALVIGGDVDPNLMELAAVRRRGTGRSTLMVDLVPQPAAAEGMSCALVVGARYVERIVACTELRLGVAR